MATPTDPSSNSPPPIHHGGPQQQPPVQSTSYIDPSGAWSKFLSVGGNIATPQEVQMFMQGILKMFNVLIQQQSEAYHRSNEQLKKAEEGED